MLSAEVRLPKAHTSGLGRKQALSPASSLPTSTIVLTPFCQRLSEQGAELLQCACVDGTTSLQSSFLYKTGRLYSQPAFQSIQAQ